MRTSRGTRKLRSTWELIRGRVRIDVGVDHIRKVRQAVDLIYDLASRALQPRQSVTVTQYVPGARSVIEEVVAPFVHWKVKGRTHPWG